MLKTLPKAIEVPLLGAGLVAIGLHTAVNVLDIEIPKNILTQSFTCTANGMTATADHGLPRQTMKITNESGDILYSHALSSRKPRYERTEMRDLAKAFCASGTLPALSTDEMNTDSFICEGRNNGRKVVMEEGILASSVSVRVNGGEPRYSLNSLHHTAEFAREFCAGDAPTVGGLQP